MSGSTHNGINTIAQGGRHAMLRTAMGPQIAAALADPLVIEIMVNPDGALRLDRLGQGRVDSVIAASLLTGLNSDLPGMVVAQVTEPVFDTVTGRTLLIPQGSRLIAAMTAWWRSGRAAPCSCGSGSLFPMAARFRSTICP